MSAAELEVKPCHFVSFNFHIFFLYLSIVFAGIFFPSCISWCIFSASLRPTLRYLISRQKCYAIKLCRKIIQYDNSNKKLNRRFYERLQKVQVSNQVSFFTFIYLKKARKKSKHRILHHKQNCLKQFVIAQIQWENPCMHRYKQNKHKSKGLPS